MLDSLCRDHPSYSTNAKVFIQDLKRFGSQPDGQTRLLLANHRFFLGEPYFASATVTKILNLPLHPSTVGAHLDGLMDKKAERGQAEELCASHDLAPIFLRAFGLGWETFKNEKLSLVSTKDRTTSKPLKKRSTMNALSKAFSKLNAKEERKDQQE